LATFLTAADEWIALTPEGFFVASPKGVDLVAFVRGLSLIGRDQVEKALHRPDLVQQKLAGDPAGRVKAAAAMIAFE
jgi:hypothetical protein